MPLKKNAQAVDPTAHKHRDGDGRGTVTVLSLFCVFVLFLSKEDGTQLKWVVVCVFGFIKYMNRLSSMLIVVRSLTWDKKGEKLNKYCGIDSANTANRYPVAQQNHNAFVLMYWSNKTMRLRVTLDDVK